MSLHFVDVTNFLTWTIVNFNN